MPSWTTGKKLLLKYLIIKKDDLEGKHDILCRGKKELETRLLELHKEGVNVENDREIVAQYRGNWYPVVSVHAGDISVFCVLGIDHTFELI